MQAVIGHLKDEFSTKKLGWTMSTEERIIMDTMAKLPGNIVQRRTKKTWVIWKIVAAVLGVLAVLETFLRWNRYYPFGQLFIYVTNWTIIFEAIYLVATCCLCVKLLKHDVEQVDVDSARRLHWIILCMWILQDLVLICAVTVSILFWGLVYTGGYVSFHTIIVHVLNTVLVLPDMFFPHYHSDYCMNMCP